MGSTARLLGAGFAAPSPGWGRRAGAGAREGCTAPRMMLLLLRRESRQEGWLQQLLWADEAQTRKISDCKTIQSFLSRFSTMLRWYLHKQSVQRINFPHLIFYRHFYKTLKTVLQYHASEAMLRKRKQKRTSNSCWVLRVLLKAMDVRYGFHGATFTPDLQPSGQPWASFPWHKCNLAVLCKIV